MVQCKESTCNAGDLSSIPGLGRSPGEGNVNPLRYSCLRNSMDRGAWQATVHEVSKSWTWLNSDHKSPLKGYYEDSAERAKAFVQSIRPSAGDVQLLSIFRRAVQLYSFTGVWSWIFLEGWRMWIERQKESKWYQSVETGGRFQDSGGVMGDLEIWVIEWG